MMEMLTANCRRQPGSSHMVRGPRTGTPGREAGSEKGENTDQHVDIEKRQREVSSERHTNLERSADLPRLSRTLNSFSIEVM